MPRRPARLPSRTVASAVVDRAAPGPAWVARDALLRRALDARTVLLAAPGGFGKTTFAEQLAELAELTRARLVLSGPTGTGGLIAGLARALRRSGLSDVAGALADAGEDDALDRLLGSLSARPDAVLLTVDEAHLAGDDAEGWLAALALDLPARCRLVVAGRRPLASFRPRPTTMHIGADDLRFGVEEVAGVLRRRPDDPVVAEVLAMSDGWPAATAIAGAMLAADPGWTPAAPAAGRGIMAALLGDLLGEHLDDVLPLLAAPLLSPGVAEIVAAPGAYDRLLDAGVPTSTTPSGWVTVPDAVREAFGAPPTLTSGQRARLIEHYAAADELPTALDVATAAGDFATLLDVLGRRHWTEIERLGTGTLRALVAAAGADIARSPDVSASIAQSVDRRDVTLKRAVIDRALAHGPSGTAALRLKAEQAIEAVRDGDYELGRAIATGVIERCEPSDAAVRGRALTVVGMATASQATPASIAAADPIFAEAAAALRLAREPRWESYALNRRALMVSLMAGRFDAAIEQFELSLALAGSSPTARATGLCDLAEALDHAGRTDEAEALAVEARAIGNRQGDPHLIAWAAWELALIFGRRGDPRARRHASDVDGVQPPWLSQPTGHEFLADMAHSMLRCGDVDGYHHYRARVEEHTADQPSLVVSVRARFEAMHGDPRTAIELLDSLADAQFNLAITDWSRQLHLALAHRRLGDLDTARALVTDAVAEVSMLGVPDLPQRHEALLVSQLADVWPATGAAPAARITLLGRFTITRGSRDVTPPPGQASTLVKLLAVDGPQPVEQAIDLLWPDADVTTDRKRLRNLLNRLKAVSGELVVRRGDVLELAPGAELDTRLFEQTAAHALRTEPPLRAGLARLAIDTYGGDLPPDDAHEDWAAAPRERLRRRYLAMLDIATDDALARGDLDEAVRMLDAAIVLEPLDESRYLRAGEALLVQGRRASARDLLSRGIAVADDLGVEASAELRALHAQVS